MDARCCGSCRHYDPAPTWRKGWCRNSSLFSPRQSHLVQDDELDCSRGSEDFWEPRRDQPEPRSEIAGQTNVKFPKRSPLRLFAPARPEVALAGVGGTTMFASDSDDDGYDPPPRRERVRSEPLSGSGELRGPRGTSGTGGRQRTVQFQPEERYWTEYLRIALPIVGLLLMIGLFWYWAQALITEGDDPDPAATMTPEGAPALIADASTPEPTNTPPVANSGAQQPPVPTETPATPPAGASVDDAGAEGNAQAADVEGQSPIGLAIDGPAVINDSDVRLRPNASTADEPIAMLQADTAVTIVSGPTEAEDYTWWQISVDDTGETGWVAENFLDPVGEP